MTTQTRERPANGPSASAAMPPSGGGTGGGDPHELVRFAHAVDAALDRVAQTPVWSMSAEEQREALRVLSKLESRISGLRLGVLAGADDRVGADSGAASTAAWLAAETRQTRARCAADVRLAAALDGEFTATRAALAAGRINPAQARVVVQSVDLLTAEHDDLPPGTRAAAEEHLLDLAAEFDAVTLRRLGKRLFEVVCPGAADRAEGERLAKEERRARRLASCTFRDNGDGTVDGRFRLPALHAELLKKALHALTSPRRLGQGRFDPETGKRLGQHTLLGRGLMDLLEHHLAVDRLPGHGGSPFTLVVTIGIDALMSGLGAAALDTGGRISAGQARRLACQAGIIPAVLGGDSVPLDLGREQRLYSKHQRLALAVRHHGCAETNCDRPADWVEIHHHNPWSRGGRTDLHNAIPLCPPHHHMADHPDTWAMHTTPRGGVRFTRRQ